LSQLAASTAFDGKASDIAILDLRKLTIMCDHFVVCTARNSIHAKAVAEGIEEKLRESGRRPSHIEGMYGGGWVLMDYGDVIVHVFLAEEREFYDLERLWADAKVQQIEDVVNEARGAGRVDGQPSVTV
jgi:ribosome-associated protein